MISHVTCMNVERVIFVITSFDRRFDHFINVAELNYATQMWLRSKGSCGIIQV